MREAETNLTMEMVDLTILCKTKANLNGKVKIKARPSGNVDEEELVPIEEEVILTLEVDFMVNVIDVVKMVIDHLNARNLLKVLEEML